MRATAVAIILALVLAGCSDSEPASTTDDGSTTSAPPSTTTAASGTATTSSTGASDPSAVCDGAFPAFPAGLAPDPLDVEGTPGPAPGAPDPESSQQVAHWLRGGDVFIEMRWPATPVPEAGAEEVLGTPFEISIWPLPENASGRIIASVLVDSELGPCARLSVEAFGARPEPAYDELFAFVTALRPIDEKSGYVAEVRAAQAPITNPNRPPGLCEEPIPTQVGEFGRPERAAAQTLVDHFLADRAVGAAAEQCLTVTALRAYQGPEPGAAYPGPCLFACDGGAITFLDAEIASLDESGVQLLVSYRVADGSEIRLREWLTLTAVGDAGAGHSALIDGVWIAPESYVDDAVGRLVIEDLLDALAAAEYDIAMSYLVNEGTTQEVEERLGDPFRSAPVALLTDFCRNAACNAAYTIGETVALDAWSRTYRVTFDTAAGPVAVDIPAGMFEGIVTAGNLPPDGTAAPAPSPAERIFGTDYAGPLTMVRYQALERVTAGRSDWSQLWRARWLERFAVAGGTVIEDRPENMGGGVHRLNPASNSSDVVAEAPATLLGASRAAGRSVAFVAEGDRVDVVDLATLTRTLLRDLTDLEATVYGVDGASGSGRLLMTLGVGESTWFELYEFDETSLMLGDLIIRIDPPGVLGVGHLGPGGETIVSTYDDSFYDPAQTVAVLDAGSGSVIGRWTVADPDTIGDLDYDGRWIVAHLTDDGLFVIDTQTSNVRRVDTSIRVRFG